MPPPSSDAIRTEPHPCCRSCGSAGRVFAEGLRDRVYAVPGSWTLKRCENAKCGAVWLDPCPAAADIPKLYETYFTHGEPAAKGRLARFSEWFYRVTTVELLARRASEGSRQFPHTDTLLDETGLGFVGVPASAGWGSAARKPAEAGTPTKTIDSQSSPMSSGPREPSLARRANKSTLLSRLFARLFLGIGPIRENVIAQSRWLHPLPPGRLFDVGCGSGEFMANMAALGWTCSGLEPDALAADEARKKGFTVTTAAVEELAEPPGTYDAVTLVHVVEHLQDAEAVLRRCRELLKPGGVLLVVTPNVRSLSAKEFGPAWFGWEIPRHLHMLGPESLLGTLSRAGFTAARVHTSSHVASGMWRLSRHIRERGSVPHMNAGFAPWLWFPSAWFQIREYLRCRWHLEGEELIAFAWK